MKTWRIGAFAAATVAAALVLSACGSSGGDEDSPINEDSVINVGWNQPMFSLNSLTPNGNATANNNILYMTRAKFFHYDKDLNVIPNDAFGTYEKISDNPLKVKYTISDDAEWSDGVPVSATDLLLQWAAESGKYNDNADKISEDEETGDKEVAEGQVFFDGVKPGMALVTEVPEVSENNKEMTVTYSKPYADWQYAFDPLTPPAHITAMKALEVDDADEALTTLEAALKSGDRAVLSPVSDFWNTGYNTTKMPDDKSLVVSSGAYIIDDWKENQYVTLKLNPDYTWGPKPTIETVNVRFNEDPMAQVQALQNGELDLIQPQSSTDVLEAVNGLDGVKVITGPEGTYEHIDITFDNKGPFDAATYGGDNAKANKVRQAFLLTVPRDEILTKLIKPLQEDATVRDSVAIVPGAPDYDEMIKNNGSDFYAKTDIDKAKSLLQEAGVTDTVDVRLMYGKSNVRRADTFQLIAESAKKAGFNVIDAGTDDWGSKLGDGTYDASLFGWESTSTGITESVANYIDPNAGGLNNFGHYDSAEVNKLAQSLLVSTDPAKQLQTLIDIEKHLYADGFSLILYQFPGVVAYNDSVKNASTITLSPTIFWNFWEWELS